MSERLDEIKARAEAATEGPWENNGSNTVPIPGVIELDSPTHRNNYNTGVDVDPADCEFIAHARTDVVALVAAVEAVLAQHQPDASGDCDECGSAYYADFVPVEYPCPTVTAIRTALGDDA